MNGLVATQAAPIGGDDDRTLHRALHRFVQGQLRDRADSEDLVQETYVRLYDYRTSRTVHDVGAFCFAVARNLIMDHLRRRKLVPSTDQLCDQIICQQPRADEIMIHRQRVEILVAALGAMPPLRREVFLRRRLEGDSVAKVAADLDLTPAAIDKHVWRATAGLRTALERRDLWIGSQI